MSRFLICIFFLFGSLCYSQVSVDKLIDSLNLSSTTKKKIDLCQKIALELKYSDWQRANTYLELAESEANKTDNPEKYLGPIYDDIASLYYSKDVFDVTLDYYLKAYNIYEKVNNSEALAKSENNLSIVYARLNNKEKALEHFQNVYKNLKQKNDSLGLAQILNNMGTLYLEQDIDSALNYYQKSYAISKSLNNDNLSAYIYTNLARAYTTKDDTLQANFYFKKALSTTNTAISDPLKAFVFHTLSQHYLKQQENDSAIIYAKKAVDLMENNYYTFNNQDAINTLYKAYINK